MIPPVVRPVVRRAILDFMHLVGGEVTDDTLHLQLNRGTPHRLALRDVGEQMGWLAEQGLIELERLGPYHVGRVLPDGVDAAEGRLAVDGLWRHKTRSLPDPGGE